jgi:hypothetical protein
VRRSMTGRRRYSASTSTIFNGLLPLSLKQSHPIASALQGVKDFRLVAKINYAARIIEIRLFGTHDEYDAIDGETV